MIGIYKIISPTNKPYIGQSINIKKRFGQYKRFDCKNQNKLYNSLVKYGWDAHKKDILEECSIEQLNERETYWKQYYLNQVGGDWNKVLFYELYDNGGGPRSEEIKNKIRESSMGKNGRSINQYTKEGKFVKTWNTIVEAEKIFKRGIKGVLSRQIYTAGGYIWRYVDEGLEDNFFIPDKHHNCKIVLQYDLNNNPIKEWESVTEIQDKLGYYNSNISACCNNKQKTAYGYIWKYK
jgi:group I intron endonuclease